jgi:XisI protein
MAKIDEYRQYIQDLLREVNGYGISSIQPGLEQQLIFDVEHDHYLLTCLGWERKQYVYDVVIHVDIKDDKIWLQQNNTEINLADRLIEMGVSKENIVIGFQSPFMRQFSGYAVS